MGAPVYSARFNQATDAAAEATTNSVPASPIPSRPSSPILVFSASKKDLRVTARVQQRPYTRETAEFMDEFLHGEVRTPVSGPSTRIISELTTLPHALGRAGPVAMRRVINTPTRPAFRVTYDNTLHDDEDNTDDEDDDDETDLEGYIHNARARRLGGRASLSRMLFN